MRKFMNLKFLVQLCVPFLLFSCVNKDYDFSDIVTDDITIGDKVTLPLGKTSKIFLNDFVDIDNIEEIKIASDGVYYIDYSGKIDVPQFNDIQIDDVSVAIDYDIPTGVIPTLFNVTNPLPLINIANFSVGVDAQMPKYLERVDSVSMAEGSRLCVVLSLEGYNIKGLEGDFGVEIMFPKGYEFDKKAGFRVNSDGRYLYKTSFDANEVVGKVKMLDFKVLKLGSLENANIDVKYSIQINKVAFLSETVGANPKINAHINMYNNKFTELYGKFNVEESFSDINVDISEVFDIFDEGSVLSFYNPALKLYGLHNLGFDTKIDFVVEGVKGADILSSVNAQILNPKTLTPNSNIKFNYWLSDGDVPADWVSVPMDLNKIISVSPSILRVKGTVRDTDSKTPDFISSTTNFEAYYKVEVPFQTKADFRIGVEESIDDIFTEDLANSFFESGSIEFYGTFANTFPLDLLVDIKMTDMYGKVLNIDFKQNDIKGGKDSKEVIGDISFAVEQKDMAEMKKARNVIFNIMAKSNQDLEGLSITDKNYIQMVLKVKKTGGISLK